MASQSGYATLEKLGLDRTTVSRWRSRLKDEEKFETTLKQAKERAVLSPLPSLPTASRFSPAMRPAMARRGERSAPFNTTLRP